MHACMHCVCMVHMYMHMRVNVRFVEKRGGAERYGGSGGGIGQGWLFV